MSLEFIPPRPEPQAKQPHLIRRFLLARRCTLKLLYEKSYSMKMGKVRLPRGLLYMINEPALVRRVLVEQWAKYPKSRYLWGGLKPLIGNGVLMSNGPLWERQRRMIVPAFDARGLQDLFPLMAGAADAMIARFGALTEKPVEIDIEMTHVTADIMFRTIFSLPLSRGDAQATFDAFQRYQDAAPAFAMLQALPVPDALVPSRRRVKRAAAEIRGFLERMVRPRYDAFRHTGEDAHQDILAALMKARDPKTDTVFDFTELLDQVAVFFVGGHESTASTLAWALYLLAQCPHIQERVHAEAIAVMGARAPAFADVKKLKFTRDVFREVLRLYPAFGFVMREATEPERMRDKNVCPADTLVISPWLIQRHRTYWERPDVFDPDRFKTESAKQSLRTAYLPFGLGPRVCLGAGFALQEAVLILSLLVRAYRFAPVAGHEPKPIGRLTIRSENGIRLTVAARATLKP